MKRIKIQENNKKNSQKKPWQMRQNKIFHVQTIEGKNN